MFSVKGFYAISEVDSFEHGCTGKTRTLSDDYFKASAATLDGLIDILKVEFCADDNCVFLNSCEDLGRLDIQVEQREPFKCAKPSAATMHRFKAGEINLFLTCYTFQVFQTGFDLAPLTSRVYVS